MILSQLIGSALKNRAWVFVAFAVIMILGIDSAMTIPIDAVPDITNVQVVVNTRTGALDPGKIERLVTYPIETEIAGVQRVEEVRSLSKYGLSQVTIVFEEGTNVYFARQLVSERLQRVRETLPQGLSPELAPVTTGLGEVLMYILDASPDSELAKKSKKEQLLYLREVQDFIVRPYLKKVQGVADVDTNGGYLKQIHINFEPYKLQHYGISLEKFIAKITTIGESFGGGYIQRDGSQLIVRTTGRILTVDTIGNISLGLNVSGKPIRIRDVAQVSVDHALRLGAATHRGSEAVLGTVLMRVGANSREVASRAEHLLKDEIKVPDDVLVKIVYSRSHLVNATVHTILKNLVEGAILVIGVLLLFLGNIRAALIAAVAIPFSMLFALKGMQILGVSANLMSLGAIDFGLLVDGSIVLVENVIRRLEQSKGQAISPVDKMKLVIDSSQEVLRPLVFGLAIIMLVYVPILYLEGIEGKMFHPMAITVLMALLGSLIVALFLMPALAYLFIPASLGAHREPRFFSWVRTRYGMLLTFARGRVWIAPALTLIPGLIALVLFMRLGADFIPQFDEGDLVINLTRESQQDIDTSVRYQQEVEGRIASFGEVEDVFSRMGTPESALDPMSPGLADTFVILKKDHSQWPIIKGKRRTKDELFEAIRRDLTKLAIKQEMASTQPIEMRFNEILEGSRADVSLRILGPDLDQLLEYSEQIKKILSDMSGVSSLESDPLTALTKSPVLDVVLDYAQMARYGVSLSEVNSVLESAMSGKEVGSFYVEDRRFPVVLHLDERVRNDIESISQIPVGLPEGGTIPLSAVTQIETHDQVTTVARTGARRYSAISIYIKDRDLAGFVAEAKARIARDLKLKPGYEVTWGGQFKNLEKARRRLIIIIPFMLAVILLLLLRGFGSMRHALLVFAAIPFAMVGGVFSLWIREIHFSVSASIGFIALAGIATLNSLVLVTFFNQLRDKGVSLENAVLEGAMSRLRPVLTTALVASLGFIPMALNTGTGAEVQRPLATVVIGGLVTSTALTLLVIPVFYLWMERRRATIDALMPVKSDGAPHS